MAVHKTPAKRAARHTKASQAVPSRPDDVWTQNPEVIQRFLRIRRDYDQLCGEVEYILRKRVLDRGIEMASITSRAKTL